MVLSQWWVNYNPITSNTFKTEKGKLMNEDTRRKLEENLKKMINNSDQIKTKKERQITKTGTGNVIRRRAGEKEKRFSA